MLSNFKKKVRTLDINEVDVYQFHLISGELSQLFLSPQLLFFSFCKTKHNIRVNNLTHSVLITLVNLKKSTQIEIEE